MVSFWLQNLVAYCLQIGAVALAGGVLLRLLRVRIPGVRLICWQSLLAICLLLPAIQPWHPAPRSSATVQISTGDPIPLSSGHSRRWSFPLTESILAILGAGALFRFAMLGAGFWRIRRYRHESTFVPGAFEDLQRRVGVFADVRMSPDVAGPATFGLLWPVVLLPDGCARSESIACHELVHVRRRDWLFNVIEECVLSVLWFHPAMWWLVSEIQLAREEAVDREVVRVLNSREQYLDSLLALAASKAGVDLVPASPFLRKRHLQKRVASLLKEVSMSRLRLNSSLAAFAAVLAAIGWLSVRSFPLQAAPQEKMDAPGVTVQQNSLAVLHRAPVRYPREALNKGIEGNVVVEVSVSESGTVNDARVLSGPEELRSAALQSVLQWHFANDAHAALKTQTTITFDLAAQRSAPGKGFRVPPPPPPPASSQTVDRILYAVPDDLKQKIESRITLREGDQLSGNTVADLHNTIASIDEHLRMVIQTPMNAKGANVIFMLENGQAEPQVAAQAGTGTPPSVIRVGGTVQAFNLIDKVPPIYPQDAKMARIQGVVRFTAIIDKTGHVTSLQLISGHPLLVNAARDAVAQWVYKPTLLNGNPVDVTTQIDVNFTLTP